MTKKSFRMLTALCCLVYFTSYITRTNFAAALAEIVRDMELDKSAASLAVTGSFITYGAGQIFSGFIGDRVSPRIMVALGLIGSSACNLAVAVLTDINIISAVWCINGFFQSMMWPPLARILGENLDFTDYTRSCAFVTAASSCATIAVYLTVPFSIIVSGWRLSFVWSAVFALLVAVVWLFFARRFVSPKKRVNVSKTESAKVPLGRIIASSGLIYVMAVIVLQGILRDGITTWMPTYITEVFDMGTSGAILTTVILPVFSIICLVITTALLRRLKSEFRVTVILWSIVLLASALLALVRSSGIIATVALMALITGSMYGINLMLIGNLPARFKSEGCISTVSGILNAFTYIGSAISAYGFAAVSEHFGWGVLIISWCVMAAAAIILSMLANRRWKAFR